MNEHLTWEALNDLVDGVLAASDEARARAHLAHCSECRTRLDDLETTLREVATVAREITPPEASWPALRAEIERRKLVTLLGAAPRGGPLRQWRLAAAAVVLMVASSAVTVLVMRGRDGAAPLVAGSTAAATTALPAAVLEAERGYLASVQELSVALETARPHLAPETIAIVERNLELIDAAIAESRAALARDPGNRVLLDVLAGTYRQKLDLLRRAAQLASS